MMGLLMINVSFDEEVPSLEEITQQVMALTGLELLVAKYAENEHCLYQANLAFSSAPSSTVNLVVYRAREKNVDGESCPPDSIFKMSNQLARYIPNDSNSSRKSAGRSYRVHLNCHIAEEPTLMTSIQLALVELGGNLQYPIDLDQARSSTKRITSTALKKRHRLNTLKLLKLLPLMIIGALMLPFTLLYEFIHDFGYQKINAEMQRVFKAVQASVPEMQETDLPTVSRLNYAKFQLIIVLSLLGVTLLIPVYLLWAIFSAALSSVKYLFGRAK